MSELALMSPEEAFETVVEINGHLELAYVKILDLYNREGWKALGYENWRSFAQTEFQVSQRRAYQLLDFAKIQENLVCTNVQKPETEAVARPLTKLPAEQQPAAWETAVARSGGAPTAKVVQAVVDEVLAAPATPATPTDPPGWDAAAAAEASNKANLAQLKRQFSLNITPRLESISPATRRSFLTWVNAQVK